MKQTHILIKTCFFLLSIGLLYSCHRYDNSGIRSQTNVLPKGHEFGRMWTFDNPPLDYLENEYGFLPDKEWLYTLQLSSLRLGGNDINFLSGSASFVSPKGLILTNTRCIRDAISATWPRDINLLKTGFVAPTQSRETRLKLNHDEWMTAAQLLRITDITTIINEGLDSLGNSFLKKEKQTVNKQKVLENARNSDPNLIPQIVSLFHGGKYHLYQYKVFDDIRLVCFPHLQAAHFGGDTDNFSYPRYNLDFAFLRAYENGQPANTEKHFLEWKTGGAEKGELVFISGNPGTTNRLKTKAQLELERDISLPMKIEHLKNSLRILKDPRSGTYSGEFDPENPSKYWAFMRTKILGLENGLKAAIRNLEGLQNSSLFDQKIAAEQALKACVMADEELSRKYDHLWDDISNNVRKRRQLEPRLRFHTTGGHALFEAVVDIVKLNDPAETDEQKQKSRENLDSWAGGTIRLNFHGDAGFTDHVERAKSWLPNTDPYLTNVLGGMSGEEFLNLLSIPESISSSGWLGYPEQRDALIKGGWQAVLNSKNPLVIAARELVKLQRENNKLSEALYATEEVLNTKMAKALKACYDQETGPDGTMTLRFSDGVVRGISGKDQTFPDRTNFKGLFDRNNEFNNQYPFNLPQVWLSKKSELELTKPLNFTSTNDVNTSNMILKPFYGGHVWKNTGSNSGSVVVNKSLEVVGVVVDGNLNVLNNDYFYNEDFSRAISVHVDGIIEALSKIYDAQHIVNELSNN